MRRKNDTAWEEQTKQIEAERKKTGVSAVKQGARMPRWLRQKIKKALTAHNVAVTGYFSAGACWIWFQHFLAVCNEKTSFVSADGAPFFVSPNDKFSSIFDHAGTTKIDGYLCFVVEPYQSCDTEKYEQELDTITYTLSRVLGCLVTWSSVSWHYPGRTYRILFEEE